MTLSFSCFFLRLNNKIYTLSSGSSLELFNKRAPDDRLGFKVIKNAESNTLTSRFLVRN